MKKLIFTIFTFTLLYTNLYSQEVLINQIWTTSSGDPSQVDFPISGWGAIDWNSSILTNSNELVTVGNTLQPTGDTDVLITKQSSQGNIIWEQTFAGAAGSNDYGFTITQDSNGDFLVAGIVTTSNQTTDIVVLKYAPNGTLLWSETLDGGNNSFDIVTNIITDTSGNVYLIGGTLNAVTKLDWVISKLNSNGIEQWMTTYNYANLDEIAVSIKTLSGGDISVGGFSNQTASVWDFVELRLSGGNGSILAEKRKTIPDLSLSDNISLASDNLNNIYIGGTTTGTNKDIQLVKINNNFDIEWIKTIDLEGLEDTAKSLAVDNEGNIIVAGNSKKSNNGTQITISKFSSSGELKFKRDYMAPSTFEEARVSKITVNSQGDIFVAGTADNNGNKDYITLMYDKEGSLRIEKFFNGENNTKDIAQNINVSNGGDILVTGKSLGSDSTTYTTVKYQIFKRSDEVILENNKPHHRAHEFIVKFAPEYVDTGFVDDKTKCYGSIYDILDDNVAAKIANEIDLSKVLFSKVFPRLTTSHTQSTTRLGETIPIPEFWSVFLVVLDVGQNLEEFISNFEGLEGVVVYAHPNHIYEKQTTPNDLFFTAGRQESLFPTTTFPDADINVEPAWDIETGQDFVRAGVVGNVIFWAHEDFGDGTFEGSEVRGGWDFTNNTNITAVTDPESHETACAGIIGAIRDNGRGIAGIAGGGLDAMGNNNPGIQLFSLGIADQSSTTTGLFSAAITEGAMFVENEEPTGFGLDIQNISWGGPVSDPTLEAATRFAWRNQCILVASRGNDGIENLQFPACYDDDWVINVGASGTDGEYFNGNNGNAWANNGTIFDDPGSNFGGNVDIIAPGAAELITSLINPNQPFLGEGNFVGGLANIAPAPQGPLMNYQAFYRTSAAAPHVAGVAALMYSLHNVNKGQPNNLAPEDVEFILQRYATDIVNPDPNFNYPVGYDDENGWGRLNAFEAVRRVEGPQWRVFHSGEPDEVSEVLDEYDIEPGAGGGPSWIWERYLITHTYHLEFSPSTQIIDAWSRLSSTRGGTFEHAPNLPDNKYWASYEFDYIPLDNEITVTAKTYRYELNGTPVIYSTENDIRTAFSLHLFNSQVTKDEDSEEIGFVSIFPNPTSGLFNLRYNLADAETTSLQLLDVTGKLIFERIISKGKAGELTINLSELSRGVFVCRLITDKGVISKKVVKQ